MYTYLFLSVLIGFLIALLFKNKSIKYMPLYLAFSGAFLLSITVFELLPEVFMAQNKDVGLYIMAGLLLQICLEFFSKGAEHGHVHIHALKDTFPVLLFISLSIHALIEGIPVVEENNMMLAIIIHKIPVAIILSVFFLQAKYSKLITISFMLLFALMTPLGSYLMHHVNFLHTYSTEIFAITIGMFLHVSTTILFESSKDHTFNLSKFITILVAIIIAFTL